MVKWRYFEAVTTSRNPYRTAPGSEPPELSGREGELGAARYAIEMAAAHDPPNPIVLTGLRGMGKTALLRQIGRDAEAAGGLSIVAEADRSLRFRDVMRRELRSALEGTTALPARLSTALRRILERLPSVSYAIPHEGGSIALSAAGSSEDEEPPGVDSLEDVLLTLNDQLGRHARFLMIGIDEIQESPKADLLQVIRAVHKTAGTERPILFVGAGLPNAPGLLHAVRTYTERWATYRLELLTREATFAAVALPAAALGATWTAAALDTIYVRSLGYPYFVQAFASAAWHHHRGSTIAETDVAAIALGVQRSLDESIYDRQFAQLSPREAAFVLALERLGRGAHRLEAIASAMGFQSSSALGSVRARLIAKDLIYAPARGLAEFRMPLTHEYIERHRHGIAEHAARAERP